MLPRCITFTLLATTLAACQADGPSTDKGDAQAGWRSTQVALQKAGVSLGGDGGGDSGGGIDGSLLGTVDCPDGGTVTLQAEGHVDPDSVASAADISFDGCAAEGIVIDGTLSYSASVTENSATVSMSGSLSWSGDIEGECDIDIDASVTTSGAQASGHLGGTMCGWSYDELY